MAVENVVAEDQTDRIACEELFANQKRLRQSARIGLLGVLELHSPLRAVSQQLAIQRQVMRRTDDEEVPQAFIALRSFFTPDFLPAPPLFFQSDERQFLQADVRPEDRGK